MQCASDCVTEATMLQTDDPMTSHTAQHHKSLINLLLWYPAPRLETVEACNHLVLNVFTIVSYRKPEDLKE